MHKALLERFRDAPDDAANRDVLTDPLWEEHGWVLSGRGLAVVILVVLLTSIAMQMLG